MSSQVGIFAVVGLLSTLAYGVLYLVFRQWWGAQAANAAALLATAVANTAANRRWTFGVRGPDAAMRHQLQGLLVLGVGLLATSGALHVVHPLLDGLHPTWARLAEVAVLTVGEPAGHGRAVRADAPVDLQATSLDVTADRWPRVVPAP